ncbi:diacylglycerol O-acyltransferase [Homarus americanus]|uniref:Diacylglycerol O-acyltransferase n=1 Tax=Homarus americanus TaxID=6706 RepID=A0A8J5JVT9_HOMAM|nr:diacylglycerol O-acyltransferase [Homarus americanus]
MFRIKCWRAVVKAWAVRAMEGVEEMTGVTEDVVGRMDASGQFLHPNFRRLLMHVGGYYVWMRHDNFDIDQHIIMAPLHYRGRLVTSRNIQEYVSEVVSQPLPEDLPPWRITVIATCDGGSGEDGETWVVARAHHLLASNLSLPDLLVTAYPDPWRNPATRGLTLLAAPAATRRFINTTITLATTTAGKASKACKRWCNERYARFVTPIVGLLEESIQAAHKVAPEELPAPVARVTAAILTMFFSLGGKLNDHLSSLWAVSRKYLNLRSVFHAWVLCVVWSVGLWWLCVVWWLKLPWTICVWGCRACLWVKEIRASEEYAIVVDAVVEVYWMIRAFVSLPRLVLEEAFSIRGVTPLMGWVGRRQRTLSSRGLGRTGGMAVAWSDSVPLSTARGVRGATGASLTEVLLTASAGAVRDYLRVTGLPVPDEVCCTLPVYSQRWADSRGTSRTPGLVTMALPTGAAEASTALHIVRESMEKVHAYPERYLASVWLMRNVAYFLPESLLGSVFRALSARYPVLMSNLAGPSEPINLWGHDLLNIFYWRPPQDGAVLSVCVASYQGQAHLGVVADGRVVPNAATMPQAFVTHLNELAVNTGGTPVITQLVQRTFPCDHALTLTHAPVHAHHLQEFLSPVEQIQVTRSGAEAAICLVLRRVQNLVWTVLCD